MTRLFSVDWDANKSWLMGVKPETQARQSDFVTMYSFSYSFALPFYIGFAVSGISGPALVNCDSKKETLLTA